MIIDAHVHVHRPEVMSCRSDYCELDPHFGRLYASARAKMATVDELIQTMDADGVDVSVINGFNWCDAGLCREDNDYVIEAMRRFPDRLIGLAVVNPTAGTEAVREMERCAAAGLRGLGELMPDGEGYRLDDAGLMRPVMEAAQALGWPVLTHSNEQIGHDYPGKGRTGPEIVLRFAENFPDAKIVCAHWGGGLIFYELMPEVRQALRNVYYDTAASSFLYDDAVYRIASQIVPHKILFGSDYPLLRPRHFLARIRAAGLEPGAERSLLGDNAVRLFNLETESDRQDDQGLAA